MAELVPINQTLPPEVPDEWEIRVDDIHRIKSREGSFAISELLRSIARQAADRGYQVTSWRDESNLSTVLHGKLKPTKP